MITQSSVTKPNPRISVKSEGDTGTPRGAPRLINPNKVPVGQRGSIFLACRLNFPARSWKSSDAVSIVNTARAVRGPRSVARRDLPTANLVSRPRRGRTSPNTAPRRTQKPDAIRLRLQKSADSSRRYLVADRVRRFASPSRVRRRRTTHARIDGVAHVPTEVGPRQRASAVE